MKEFETIINTIVYEYFGITKRDYLSRRREQVLARQIATSFFVKFLNYSETVAGNVFAKNHATSNYSKRTIENLKNTDKRFKYDYQIIDSRIKNAIEGAEESKEQLRKIYESMKKDDLIDIIFGQKMEIDELKSNIEELNYKQNEII